MSKSGQPSLANTIQGTLARDRRITAWQLRSTRERGVQTYLAKDQMEAERRTDGETHQVSVFVKNGEMLGRAGVTIQSGEAGLVSRKIDDAIFMAGLGGDAPWSLPAAGAGQSVQMFDDALAGEKAAVTSRDIVAAWRSAVKAQSGARPSSMELFCGETETTHSNSAGFTAREHTTRVSMLTLLLASGDRAAERVSWEERRRASDLDVRAIVGRVADEARDLTSAKVPPSGNVPVVIDASELTGFLSPIQANAAADGLYQKSSRFEIGKPLPIEVKGGEPFTLYSNAVTPYGLQSYAFDADGVAGQRIALIENNVFTHPWATKQFADYLKVPATGAFGNWEIPAGVTPLAELTGGDGPVLYVRAFSWLTPDGARGNFGTEIRVGYW
ncbi:MAG: metallopeptidase TldD-related protein, partial [Candidatus Eiseniibacteriota bacterium]